MIFLGVNAAGKRPARTAAGTGPAAGPTASASIVPAAGPELAGGGGTGSANFV